MVCEHERNKKQCDASQGLLLNSSSSSSSGRYSCVRRDCVFKHWVVLIIQRRQLALQARHDQVDHAGLLRHIHPPPPPPPLATGLPAARGPHVTRLVVEQKNGLVQAARHPPLRLVGVGAEQQLQPVRQCVLQRAPAEARADLALQHSSSGRQQLARRVAEGRRRQHHLH